MIKIYVNHQRQSLITLYKRSPNTEFFLVHIFPYSIQIPENMDKKKLAFRPFSHSIKPFLLVCSFWMGKIKHWTHSLKKRQAKYQSHRPVCLFAILEKFFEGVIFNKMLSVFLAYKLISPNQSGFKPANSMY